MKKILLTSFFTIFFLTLDFAAFAQPGFDDENDDLEGQDPAAPINGKVLWLAIVGLAFAYYTFKKNKAVKVA